MPRQANHRTVAKLSDELLPLAKQQSMTTTRTPHPRHHYLTGASSLLPVSHQHPSSLFFPFLLLLPPEPSLHAVVVHYRREAVPSIPGARAADPADRLAKGQQHRLPIALASCSSGEHRTGQQRAAAMQHPTPTLIITVATTIGRPPLLVMARS